MITNIRIHEPRELKAHYLRLYKKADDILKQPNNPCQIQMIDGKATCTISRKNKDYAPETLCCNNCSHHSREKGCLVKALGCKLGWCFSAHNAIVDMNVEDHPMFAAIEAIKREARFLGLPLWGRQSCEEAFKEH